MTQSRQLLQQRQTQSQISTFQRSPFAAKEGLALKAKFIPIWPINFNIYMVHYVKYSN